MTKSYDPYQECTAKKFKETFDKVVNKVKKPSVSNDKTDGKHEVCIMKFGADAKDGGEQLH